MTDMAILFVFAISYFSLMTERGLFEPMVRWMERIAARGVTVLLLAVMAATFVVNIAGSGATTFLVVVPTFCRYARRLASGGRRCCLPWAVPLAS